MFIYNMTLNESNVDFQDSCYSSHVQIHPHKGEDLDKFDFFLSLAICFCIECLKHILLSIGIVKYLSLGKRRALSHEHSMRKRKKIRPNPPGSPLQAGVESNHTRCGDSFMPLPLVKPSVFFRFLINT